jgi:hypothetical protein
MAKKKAKEGEILGAINFFEALRGQGGSDNPKVLEVLDDVVKQLQKELIDWLNQQHRESKKE